MPNPHLADRNFIPSLLLRIRHRPTSVWTGRSDGVRCLPRWVQPASLMQYADMGVRP